MYLLLYLYTYNRDKERAAILTELMRDLITHDVDGIDDFMCQYLDACPEEYPSDLAHKLSLDLQDESISEMAALALMDLCCGILGSRAASFPTVELLEEHLLIPSLIVCTRRQICRAETDVVDGCIFTGLQSIQWVRLCSDPSYASSLHH